MESERRSQILGTCAAGLAAVVIVMYGWSWLFHGYQRTATELAAIARNGDSEDVRQRAAVELISSAGEALANLRNLAVDCDDSAVRATCIQGLGTHQDLDSIDLIIQALSDPSPLVRTRAKHALGQLWNRPIYFPVDGTVAERERSIKSLQAMWANFQRWGVVEHFRNHVALSYFYDIAKKEVYEAPTNVPVGSTKDTVQAHMYCCGEPGPAEQRFVGFISISGSELERRGELPAGQQADEETLYVSSPGSIRWHSAESRSGEAIIDAVARRCPMGKKAIRCFPNH